MQETDREVCVSLNGLLSTPSTCSPVIVSLLVSCLLCLTHTHICTSLAFLLLPSLSLLLFFNISICSPSQTLFVSKLFTPCLLLLVLPQLALAAHYPPRIDNIYPTTLQRKSDTPSTTTTAITPQVQLTNIYFDFPQHSHTFCSCSSYNQQFTTSKPKSGQVSQQSGLTTVSKFRCRHCLHCCLKRANDG